MASKYSKISSRTYASFVEVQIQPRLKHLSEDPAFIEMSTLK